MAPVDPSHVPSAIDLVGYYVNTYAPALAAPIMYVAKRVYDVIMRVESLMEKQNDLLTKQNDVLTRLLNKP